MPADFQVDRQALRQLLRSDEMRRALYPTAVQIMGRAKALAGAHVRTGKYLSSFRYETGRTPNRVYVRVVNIDDAASPIEADQHILGRAAG